MNKRAGFTILELLISIGILGIIMTVVSQGFQSGGTTLGLVISQSELIDEARNAGQLMADELAKSSYVYPPGAILNLGSTYDVKRPGASDGSAWTVGENASPILAVILPPTVSGTCNVATPTACSQFVAYYPVVRSGIETGFQLGGKNVMLKNTWTGNLWTIYEFRCGLSFAELADKAIPTTDMTVAADCASPTHSLVLDYVQPYDTTTLKAGFMVDYNVAGSSSCRRPVSNSAKYESVLCSTLKDDLTIIQATPINKAKYKQGRFTTVLLARFTIQGKIQSKSNQTTSTPVFTFPVTPRNLYTF
jgi:prepilin-type N-terminal cleavage/methylation domain-containing protein